MVVAKQVAQGDWANQKRSEGAVVTVQGKNGKYFHVDDGFAALLKRESVAPNGFDMIPPDLAAKGAETMGAMAGKAYTARFPFLTDSKENRWVRLEACWPNGLLACAYWPEDDPANHEITATELE